MSSPNTELPHDKQSLRDLEFSASLAQLHNAGINSFGQLYNFFQEHSISILCFKLFNDGQLRRIPTSPNSLIEIVIKLAFMGIDVTAKIDEYITNLIERDAKYKEVKFWIDMKELLATIVKEKSSVQEYVDNAEYDKRYESVANFILQRETDFTVEEILPVEDYIELSCNKCGYKTSVHLRNIFSINCTFCTAKTLAPLYGFDALKITDLGDKEFVEDFDEYDIAFFCQLCATTNRENVLDPYESDFLSQIKKLKCRDCTGEEFLEWIAGCNGNEVVFKENLVEFRCDSHPIRKFKKADLSPQKVFECILKGDKNA